MNRNLCCCSNLFGGGLLDIGNRIAAYDLIAGKTACVINAINNLVIEDLGVLFHIQNLYGSFYLIARRRYICPYGRAHCQCHYNSKHNGHDTSEFFHAVSYPFFVFVPEAVPRPAVAHNLFPQLQIYLQSACGITPGTCSEFLSDLSPVHQLQQDDRRHEGASDDREEEGSRAAG